MFSLTQYIIVKYHACIPKHKCVGAGVCWRLTQWPPSIIKKISMKYFKPACRVVGCFFFCYNYLETSRGGFLAEICCVMQPFLLKQSRRRFGGDSPCLSFSLVPFISVWLSNPVIFTHRKKSKSPCRFGPTCFCPASRTFYEHTTKSGAQAVHPQMTFYLELDFLKAICLQRLSS